MKRLTLKKFLSLTVILSLSLGVLCFTGCKDKNDKLNIDNEKEYGICLTSSSATTVSDETGTYLEKTLTANVTADNVNADTSLNWDVRWVSLNVPSTILVSDYVKVIPESDGSNVAKVRCYKNFESYGNIIITVRSKVDSNIYATCIVTYKGEPTALFIKDSNNNRVDNGVDADVSINENSMVTYTLDLQHLLGVGSSYNNFEVESTQIIGGTFFVQCTKYNALGMVENVQDVPCSGIGDTTLTYLVNNVSTTVSVEEFLKFNHYISYSLDGNKLTIAGLEVVGKLFNGTNGKEDYSGSTAPWGGVKAMLKSQNLDFLISVKEVNSGKVANLVFKLNSDTSILGVSTVTLDYSQIEF